MLSALAASLEAPMQAKIDRATINALVKRGLLDEDASLTQLGAITAIGCLPLEKQCRSIAIPYNTLSWDSASNPEFYAYNILVQQGYVGSYCEGGGFGTAIKALCLGELTRASIFYDTCIDAREDACLKGVVALSHIEKSKLEDIFRQILHTPRAQFIAAFSEIISYSAIREWYPGLTLEFAEALFDTVPKEHFIRLAKWISLDHTHRNGWPDLTLIKDGRLKFIEVKTTDKLHHSQLVAIPALIREISADIFVLQLSRLS